MPQAESRVDPSDSISLEQLVQSDAPIPAGLTSPKKPKRTSKPTVSPREQAAIEQLRLNNESRDLDNRDRAGRIKRDADNHNYLWKLRLVLALVCLIIVTWWQCEILRIVKKQGGPTNQLDDKVMIVLLTTTTANVFGFMVIVMKFVFGPAERAAEKSRKNRTDK